VPQIRERFFVSRQPHERLAEDGGFKLLLIRGGYDALREFRSISPAGYVPIKMIGQRRQDLKQIQISGLYNLRIIIQCPELERFRFRVTPLDIMNFPRTANAEAKYRSSQSEEDQTAAGPRPAPAWLGVVSW